MALVIHVGYPKQVGKLPTVRHLLFVPTAPVDRALVAVPHFCRHHPPLAPALAAVD